MVATGRFPAGTPMGVSSNPVQPMNQSVGQQEKSKPRNKLNTGLQYPFYFLYDSSLKNNLFPPNLES